MIESMFYKELVLVIIKYNVGKVTVMFAYVAYLCVAVITLTSAEGPAFVSARIIGIGLTPITLELGVEAAMLLSLSNITITFNKT